MVVALAVVDIGWLHVVVVVVVVAGSRIAVALAAAGRPVPHWCIAVAVVAVGIAVAVVAVVGIAVARGPVEAAGTVGLGGRPWSSTAAVASAPEWAPHRGGCRARAGRAPRSWLMICLLSSLIFD